MRAFLARAAACGALWTGCQGDEPQPIPFTGALNAFTEGGPSCDAAASCPCPAEGACDACASNVDPEVIPPRLVVDGNFEDHPDLGDDVTVVVSWSDADNAGCGAIRIVTSGPEGESDDTLPICANAPAGTEQWVGWTFPFVVTGDYRVAAQVTDACGAESAVAEITFNIVVQ